ncbi:MAG: hypothetical protein AAB434_11015 [Planctomycetota bacterium]
MDLASVDLLAAVQEIQARAMPDIVLLGIDFDGTLVGYQDRLATADTARRETT